MPNFYHFPKQENTGFWENDMQLFAHEIRFVGKHSHTVPVLGTIVPNLSTTSTTTTIYAHLRALSTILRHIRTALYVFALRPEALRGLLKWPYIENNHTSYR
jgi:hypothetical protein